MGRGTIPFLLLFGWALTSVAGAGEHAGHGPPTRHEHQVPEGWTFTLPQGNPQAGRQVFITMECYKCHTVKGETFPQAATEAGDVGPDFTGIGAGHPPEYFAEAIINPNAVLVPGPGYVGADGRSKMPSYNEIMTIEQLLDLVAYLKNLLGEASAPHGARH